MKLKKILYILFILTFLFTLTGCDIISSFIGKDDPNNECKTHKFENIDKLSPTCYESGHSSYKICEKCGFIEGYERLNQLQHEFINLGTGYEKCKHCDLTKNKGEIILSLLPLDQRTFIKDLSLNDFFVFKEIYDAVCSFEKTYTFKNEITIDELSIFMNLLNYGCPELIQLEGSYTYSYSKLDNLVTSVTFSYVLDQNTYQKAYREMMTIINDIVKASQQLSEYEKELYVYDYLIDICKYDKTTLHSGSAYGLLVENKARCEGYSKAFMLIMWYLDIECFAVTGNAVSERHSWNVVKIENKYYYVDVTWDDQEDNPTLYAFFNVDSNTMKNAHHTMDEYYATRVPNCYSLSRNIPYQNDTYILDGENVYNRLQEIFSLSINREDTKIYIKIESPAAFNNVSSILQDEFNNFMQSNYYTYSYNLLTHPEGLSFLIDVTYSNPK